MFGIEKEDLKDLLTQAHDGRLQLPDFQRDYVWEDEDVKSLIASVAKGYPVGALLTLQTGGKISFKPRSIEGAENIECEPEVLLLDGQQRITSLYQATLSRLPVRTRSDRNTQIERYYYIDMESALSAGADIEKWIIGVPADRIVRKNFGRDIELDLSKREYEFAKKMFPLNQVFDSRDWFYDWRDYCKERGEDVSDLERDFDRGFVDQIARYKMPVIELDRKNSREAICLVFEKVNVGGKKLDAFELLTAVYAAEKYDLREDWNGLKSPKTPGRKARIVGIENKCDVLTKVASTEFLQACTLLDSRERRLQAAAAGKEGKELPQISCRRDALLALPLSAYRTYADRVEKGFIQAGEFLNEQKIIWHRDVPYPPLIVGLAATFAILGNVANSAAAKAKIERWFWSVTLGELFGSSTESRLARDVPELVAWIDGGEKEPRALSEAVFQQERLDSLRMRLSAAYKGMHALLMREGCRDFVSGKPTDIMTFFNSKIDIHHIFPQKWCKDQGIDPSIFNSIINKSPLSAKTNREIGGEAPSKYLARIEREHGLEPSQLDEILRSHLIEPAHLRSDDFEAFYRQRKLALTTIIEKAMQKPVSLEAGFNEQEHDAPIDDMAEAEAA